ncbi:uncharacterized protein [Hyperolius riggenbachi]|uniref:uncharacterized protein n=1 Tax=Hyperolius riggenbachi TaxID=752182 RepID=UPI0035A2CA45
MNGPMGIFGASRGVLSSEHWVFEMEEVLPSLTKCQAMLITMWNGIGQNPEMFLSQKFLQVLTFLGICCFAYLLAFDNNEKERSVAETQLMHDTGKMIEDITRQRWLQSLLETIHNPGRRAHSVLRQNKERSVAEAQLMHDKGKTIGEITRQRWLQGLLGAVHSAGRRDVPLIRNLRREVHVAGNKEHQRLSITKKNRSLQFKDAHTAYSTNLYE